MLNTIGWTNYRTMNSSRTHLVHPDDTNRTLCGRRIPDGDQFMVDYWGGIECRQCFDDSPTKPVVVDKSRIGESRVNPNEKVPGAAGSTKKKTRKRLSFKSTYQSRFQKRSY